MFYSYYLLLSKTHVLLFLTLTFQAMRKPLLFLLLVTTVLAATLGRYDEDQIADNVDLMPQPEQLPIITEREKLKMVAESGNNPHGLPRHRIRKGTLFFLFSFPCFYPQVVNTTSVIFSLLLGGFRTLFGALPSVQSPSLLLLCLSTNVPINSMRSLVGIMVELIFLPAIVSTKSGTKRVYNKRYMNDF